MSDQLLGNSRRQEQRLDSEQGSDRTHGLHYSSLRQQLSEDRTQQLWTTGRARQWRPIKSREVSERRNIDRMRQMVSNRTHQRVRSTVSTNGRLQQSGRPDATDQDDLRVRSMAESCVSSPTATFSMGLINRPPNRPFDGGRAKEIYQEC